MADKLLDKWQKKLKEEKIVTEAAPGWLRHTTGDPKNDAYHAKRITSRKHGGDDRYSHAVFVDGRPTYTGLGQREVGHYKNLVFKRIAGIKEETKIDEMTGKGKLAAIRDAAHDKADRAQRLMDRKKETHLHPDLVKKLLMLQKQHRQGVHQEETVDESKLLGRVKIVDKEHEHYGKTGVLTGQETGGRNSLTSVKLDNGKSTIVTKKHLKGVHQEELEVIDELSKEKLAAYGKRAAGELEASSFMAGHASKEKGLHDKDTRSNMKQASKRATGLRLFFKKYAKESIGESSKATKLKRDAETTFKDEDPSGYSMVNPGTGQIGTTHRNKDVAKREYRRFLKLDTLKQKGMLPKKFDKPGVHESTYPPSYMVQSNEPGSKYGENHEVLVNKGDMHGFKSTGKSFKTAHEAHEHIRKKEREFVSDQHFAATGHRLPEETMCFGEFLNKVKR